MNGGDFGKKKIKMSKETKEMAKYLATAIEVGEKPKMANWAEDFFKRQSNDLHTMGQSKATPPTKLKRYSQNVLIKKAMWNACKIYKPYLDNKGMKYIVERFGMDTVVIFETTSLREAFCKWRCFYNSKDIVRPSYHICAINVNGQRLNLSFHYFEKIDLLTIIHFFDKENRKTIEIICKQLQGLNDSWRG